jgi:NAD(P)H dehydrogenase (quinone)
MVKVLITYYSRTGNTERMAEEIAKGARDAGAEVALMPIDQADPKGLRAYDAIIMGSPTYYGSMAADCKKFLDRSVALHGKLDGRVGGAFTSSGGRAGGNETTVLDILKAWLIHGMVVQGTSGEDHYAPVAVEAPDEGSLETCRAYGARLAELAKKLRG